ncbi:MAG: 50S ribosomal protein L10 [Chloroflexota bacterium]|tara:strand:+ start:749 stop:1267 length:519 start_codon:yes stop_codon:yes gene_type:complete
MPSEKNIKQLDELAEMFQETSYLVSTQFKDISANEMVALRKALNSAGARYKIVKNNIARLAADKAALPELKDLVTGMCAIMTTANDPAQASKALFKSINDQGLQIDVLGGFLDGEVLSSDRVNQLSKLPSKEVLIANIIGQIGSPINGLVFILNSQITSLVSVLSNIVETKK